jgi:hypothetical protein
VKKCRSKKSNNIDLFFREAQFLVILPGNDVAHDMDFHYKLHPTKYELVATIATNFFFGS